MSGGGGTASVKAQRQEDVWQGGQLDQVRFSRPVEHFCWYSERDGEASVWSSAGSVGRRRDPAGGPAPPVHPGLCWYGNES